MGPSPGRGVNKRARLLRRWCGWGVAVTVATLAVVMVVSRRSGRAVPAAGAAVEGLTSVLTRSTAGLDIPLRFEDVTAAMGLVFAHMPFERESLLPEDVGSGVACGDYDDDGYDDLLFVNLSAAAVPGAVPAPDAHARLFRNVGGQRFEDVTAASGLGFEGLGMGACWGDYDNDGDLDVYVTAYGDNALYANRGDGTFESVTERSGAQSTAFSAGCAWGDYDRDGDIDLYVCNYVDFVFRDSDRSAAKAQYATEQPYTLNPSSYAPQPNILFENLGDGSFRDVAQAAGVADPGGRSLSASWVDLNNDGWVDLYVANDVSNNGVFLNRRDGTFSDIGASSLAADYRGAMGIAVADVDGDLDQDLLITHWIAQENALYRNMITDAVMGDDPHHRLWFMDEADDFGLGQISLDMVGWSTAFGDFDNDGRYDLWVVNGSTLQRSDAPRQLEAQRVHLFWNRGATGFVEVGAAACPSFEEPVVGRGGAQVDLDRDGRLDLVLVTHGGPARVFRNVSDPVGGYLRVDLRQSGGNTSALGARAYVTAAGRTQMAEVGCSSSYLSQDQRILHFGLGAAARVEVLRIVWPDGVEEEHRDLVANQQLTLRRRTPTTAAAPGARAVRPGARHAMSDCGRDVGLESHRGFEKGLDGPNTCWGSWASLPCRGGRSEYREHQE